MTLVIDYGAGNLRSVENALNFLGADYAIVTTPEKLSRADRVIFPGVGEAASSMKELRKNGLDGEIQRFVASGRPFLGICLGSQIILERSEESNTTCLGLLEGTSRAFSRGSGLKIPHMGWNSVSLAEEDPIFKGVPDNADFYFVHSYYPDPEDSSCTIASCEYGVRFTAGLKNDNVYAFQFHPEKSGPYGLKIIANFLEMTEGTVC